MPETTATSESQPLVVLTHGAWHGAWCWAALQAELDRRGVASMAIDLPGHGCSTLPFSDLHGDAQHVVDVVARLGRRVVLVGHSYGGAVITEAAHHIEKAMPAGITHLVYLAAFCLDAGESVMDLARHESGGPVDLGSAIIPIDGGLSVLDPDKATRALYGDCDELTVSAALADSAPNRSQRWSNPSVARRGATPPPRTSCAPAIDRSTPDTRNTWPRAAAESNDSIRTTRRSFR